MAIAHTGSSPAPAGDGPPTIGLARRRPERALLALRRGGWASAEQVAALQRAFVCEGLAESVSELGCRHVSVGDVCTRAGVSRRTFYELFTDVDACFAEALDVVHDRVLEAAAIGAANGGQAWASTVRGSVVEVLALLDAQPASAALLVQGPAGSPSAAAAHRAFVGRAADALCGGAHRAGIVQVVPDGVARGLVAGAIALVAEPLAVAADGTAPRTTLVGEATYLLTAPFLSPGPAAGTLRVVPPAPVRDWRQQRTLPEEGVRWRAEVAGEGDRKQILRFVAAHPGASNVLVGEHLQASESTASRRLASLAKHGLIVSEKQAGRHAWHVTEAGRGMVAGPPA